ncbi:hypothetical protein ABIA38_002390 [Embleya sp. AB8]
MDPWCRRPGSRPTASRADADPPAAPRRNAGYRGSPVPGPPLRGRVVGRQGRTYANGTGVPMVPTKQVALNGNLTRCSRSKRRSWEPSMPVRDRVVTDRHPTPSAEPASGIAPGSDQRSRPAQPAVGSRHGPGPVGTVPVHAERHVQMARGERLDERGTHVVAERRRRRREHPRLDCLEHAARPAVFKGNADPVPPRPASDACRDSRSRVGACAVGGGWWGAGGGARDPLGFRRRSTGVGQPAPPRAVATAARTSIRNDQATAGGSGSGRRV